MGFVIIILFVLMTCSSTVVKTSTFSDDFEPSRDDPFFSSFYQATYDPMHKVESVSDKLDRMPTVDEDPHFTFKYDHISPIEVDLPEVEEKTIRERRGSPEGFYNPGYYGFNFDEEPKGDEQIAANLWHGKKGKKEKKDKKKEKKDKKKDKKPEEPQSDPSTYSYNIDFDPSDEYERIKDIADQQRAQLQRDPGNCKVVIMNGQVCQECLDVFTGDTSQTCNYADELKPARYAYEKDSHFDSKTDKPLDDDFEDDPVGFVNSQGHDHDHNEQNSDHSFEQNSAEIHDYDTESLENQDTSNNEGGQTENEEQLVPYKHSIYYSEPTHEEIKSDISFPHSIDQDFFPTNTQAPIPINHKQSAQPAQKQQPQQPYPKKEATSYYKAQSKELTTKTKKPNKSKTHESLVAAPVVPVYQYSDTRKDVDRALNEFKRRDWSKCKKISKGDQTCYQCKDLNGVNHNECMTVSESRPMGVKVSFNNSRNTSYGNLGFRETTTTPELMVDESKLEEIEAPVKKRTKKVVIIKRKKTDNLNPNEKHENPDDRVVEKRTYKRMITYTGPEKPKIQFDFEQDKTSTQASNQPAVTTVTEGISDVPHK